MKVNSLILLWLIAWSGAALAQDSCNVVSGLAEAENNYSNRQYGALLQRLEALEPCLTQNATPAERLQFRQLYAFCLHRKRDNKAALERLRLLLHPGDGELQPGDSLSMETTYRMGVVHNRLGQLNEAVEAFKTCRDFSRRLNDPDRPFLADILNNLGNGYLRLGDAETALDYHRQSLNLKIELYGPESHRTAGSYTMLGRCYRLLQEFEQAANHLERAIAIRSTNPRTPRERLGSSWLNLAELYWQARQPMKQDSALQHCFSIFDPTDSEHFGYLSHAHRNQGHLSLRQKEFPSALGSFHRALDFAGKTYGPDHRNSAIILLDICEAHRELGQPKEALDAAQQALNTLVPGFTDKHPTANPRSDIFPSDPQLIIAFREKALAWSMYDEVADDDTSHLRWAHYCFTRAWMQIGNVRSSFLSSTNRERLSDIAYPTLEQAISVSLELFQKTGRQKYLEDAWNFAEHNRTLGVTEARQMMEAKRITGLPDSLFERGSWLEAHLQDLNGMLATAAETDKKALSDSIFSIRLEREAFMDTLRTGFPAYMAMKEQKQEVELSEVQQNLLDDNSLLVQFYVGSQQVVIFAITRKSISCHTLQREAGFNKHLKTFRQALTEHPILAKDPGLNWTFLVESGSWLFEHLLTPALPNKRITQIDHLLIIPDGELWHLPFEALLTQPVDEKVDYGELPYVLKSFQVDYGWSAGLLLKNNQAQARPDREPLLIVRPDFPAAAEELPALPGTQKAVKTIADLFSATVFEGVNATENALRSNSDHHQILHIATHGIIDEGNPLNSYLQLAPDSSEDGRLYSHELYGLALDADLAILGACHSGSGKLIHGEGLSSMARGFSQAGCPALVMSLWEADDQVSAQLLSDFYHRMSRGSTASSALRQSKLDYIENVWHVKAHPYYWAVWVKSGQPMSLPHPGWPWYNWVLLLTLPGVFGLLVYRRIRRNTQRPTA